MSGVSAVMRVDRVVSYNYINMAQLTGSGMYGAGAA